MTDGDRQSVCRVIRPGNGRKAQKAPDHFHHLFLVRTAVPRDRLLDLQRSVFRQGNALFLGCEQYSAAPVGDGDARGDVRVEEELLDADDIGAESLYQLGDVMEDPAEPAGEPFAGRSRDNAVTHGRQSPALIGDDAESDGGYAGIDPENGHGVHLKTDVWTGKADNISLTDLFYHERGGNATGTDTSELLPEQKKSVEIRGSFRYNTHEITGRLSHKEVSVMTQITKDTLISEVLDINPDAAPVFFGMGMHCLGCAMASGETVGEAAEVHGVDLNALLAQLNTMVG